MESTSSPWDNLVKLCKVTDISLSMSKSRNLASHIWRHLDGQILRSAKGGSKRPAKRISIMLPQKMNYWRRKHWTTPGCERWELNDPRVKLHQTNQQDSRRSGIQRANKEKSNTRCASQGIAQRWRSWNTGNTGDTGNRVGLYEDHKAAQFLREIFKVRSCLHTATTC